jgi:hypothetical protein
MEYNSSGKKGLVSGFSANSVTEAAQALIQISIKK